MKRFLLFPCSGILPSSICVLLAAALVFLAALTIPNLGLGFSPPLELLLIHQQSTSYAPIVQSAGNLSTAAPPRDPGSRSVPNLAKNISLIARRGGNISIDREAPRACDLYTGRWMPDPRGPLYRNDSCPTLSQAQNCQGNGRPDRDYESWRWVPDGCELARFNATEFLRIMRGKVLAFVGDSVARNQMESLVCILRQVENPVNKGSRRMQRWFFRSSSVTVVRIWSSWLVKSTPGDAAVESATRVHIDQIDDNFMDFLPQVDVLVISSGHWFVKKTAFVRGGQIVGTQGWHRSNATVTNKEAFAESMRTALNAIVASPSFKGLAVLRTFSPDHYLGGSWNTGGSCTGITKPLTDKEVKRHGNAYSREMRRIQHQAFTEARRNSSGDARLVLMDVTRVFEYRADGHPGAFRSNDPSVKVVAQDCLHWCMPGPIDTWNEFLLHILLTHDTAA